jgi:hypothetical protein
MKFIWIWPRVLIGAFQQYFFMSHCLDMVLAIILEGSSLDLASIKCYVFLLLIVLDSCVHEVTPST